jgi:hypothetical protein
MVNAFINCPIKKLKTIDARSTSSGFNGLSNTFSGCSKLEIIDEFYPSNSANFANTFGGCSALKHIIFMSDIKTSGLSLSDCKVLDKESIISVITHLSDSTSGLGVTLSQKAVNREFETSEGANDGSTSAEWLALINTKSNWTISLK